MKKILLMAVISGLVLSTSSAWAVGPGAGGGARIVDAAAAHPKAVQTGASAIAAHPAAQAKMDSSMASHPKANDLMVDIQKAGGYTPPAK